MVDIVLNLNLRGTKYEITQEMADIINNYHQDTFLKTLLETRREIEEVVDIDREPKYFKHILELYSKPISYFCDIIENIIYSKTSTTFGHDAHNFLLDLIYYQFLPNTRIKKIKSDKNRLLEAKYKLNRLKFMHNIRNIKGYISGSCVLQAYLDEEWPDSDVDVYVEYKEFIDKIFDDYHQRGLKFVDSQGNRHTTNFIHRDICRSTTDLNELATKLEINKKPLDIEKYVKKIFTGAADDHERLPKVTDIKIHQQVNEGMTRYHVINNFKNLIECKIDGKNIDLILTDKDPKLMFESFDLDLNKIYYDGYNINSPDFNIIDTKLCYFDISAICKRNYSYSGKKNDECLYFLNKKTLHRIKKYTDRGFNLVYKRNDYYSELLKPDYKMPIYLNYHDENAQIEDLI
jgi:hypothetical protein